MKRSRSSGVKLVATILTVSLSGCGVVMPIVRSEGKLSNLSMGDSRETTLSKIGKPDAVRGATTLPNGSKLQVDEYRLYRKMEAAKNFTYGIIVLTLTWWFTMGGDTQYWVEYTDGKVSKWGRAGDWRPDFTQDITVRQK